MTQVKKIIKKPVPEVKEFVSKSETTEDIVVKEPEVKEPEVKEPEVKEPEVKEPVKPPEVLKLPSNEEFLLKVRKLAADFREEDIRKRKELEEAHKERLEKRKLLFGRLDSYARVFSNCVTPNPIFIDSQIVSGDICIKETGTLNILYRIIICDSIWEVKVVRGCGTSDIYKSSVFENVVKCVLDDMGSYMATRIRI